ncbi:DUF6233 domain-containing protein [Streptomyces sp. NPDC096339]|uniref:DUF6233 domain-containing protein n=1 Tax=Streptomyces sp. NPDC096339 TaxID=3366086 RepID=UPI0038067BDB
MHAGHCWDTGKRCSLATPEQIRQLLAQDIPACIRCRPDTATRRAPRAGVAGSASTGRSSAGSARTR